MAEQNSFLESFNLSYDGSKATVALFHTSTSTIEQSSIHWIENQGKKSKVKCIGEGCPLCSKTGEPNRRMYLHLFDFTDNKEKVWDRTPKLLDQLADLEKGWGGLDKCVLEIKRVGKDFPKYTINAYPMTAEQQAMLNPELKDKKVAFRFYKTRNKQELETYLSTGILPEHQKTQFIPKEQWAAQQQAQAQQPTPTQYQQAPTNNYSTNTVSGVANNYQQPTPQYSYQPNNYQQGYQNASNPFGNQQPTQQGYQQNYQQGYQQPTNSNPFIEGFQTIKKV